MGGSCMSSVGVASRRFRHNTCQTFNTGRTQTSSLCPGAVHWFPGRTRHPSLCRNPQTSSAPRWRCLRHGLGGPLPAEFCVLRLGVCGVLPVDAPAGPISVYNTLCRIAYMPYRHVVSPSVFNLSAAIIDIVATVSLNTQTRSTT